MTFRREICKLWHDSVQIEREVIFGPCDAKYRPLHLADDANTMFAGFVGRRYRSGAGILLLAINPGGGGDAYRSRTGEDEHFYPLLRAFKRATPEHALEAFERVNDTFAEIVSHWNVWKIIKPTLKAAGKALDEVAFMNLVPYRTRADKTPPVAARRTAVKRIVEPTIDLLVPRAIVALGKKAGKIQDISQHPVPSDEERKQKTVRDGDCQARPRWYANRPKGRRRPRKGTKVDKRLRLTYGCPQEVAA